MNDTVYLLTISSTTSRDGNLYICDARIGDTEYEFDISMSIRNAKVFNSEKEAWEYRESIDRQHGGWQITPMQAKKVFVKKLGDA